MVPTPSVAITELTRTLVTISPLTRPISAPSGEHDQDRDSGIGSLFGDDEAGDQDAMQARRKTDGKVELADDHGHRQAGRDDHRQRSLVEDVGEVVDGGEGARRQQREGDDHRDEPEDRRITGEQRRARPWRAG